MDLKLNSSPLQTKVKPLMSNQCWTDLSVYYVPQRFNENSKLHLYLTKKCPELIQPNTMDCNLYEVIYLFLNFLFIINGLFFIFGNSYCSSYYNYYFQVLIALKRVITKEQLFDSANPTVIICDKELEEAIDLKSCHVAAIR